MSWTATHDYCAAAISHVPHLISAALAKLVKDADTGDYKDYMHLLAAGGFKDTTQIAASSLKCGNRFVLQIRRLVRSF